ncbi:MAG: Druantia anti-phage system protein DruA [Verrucomicrobiales bacterium]
MRYVAEVEGQWLALLAWSAASYQLAPREAWIGWSVAQKRRRLALVANNSRFLILPGVDCPNLASRVLGLCLARLSADWHVERLGSG